MDNFSVIDRPDMSRFELLADGNIVGHANYSRDGNVLTVPHVETDPRHRDKGYAARLMNGLLAEIRDRGDKINPVCPYAVAYLHKHDEHSDLVA